MAAAQPFAGALVRFDQLFGAPPADLRAELSSRVEQARCEAYDDDPGRVFRYALKRVMPEYRGRVEASRVVAEVRTLLEGA